MRVRVVERHDRRCRVARRGRHEQHTRTGRDVHHEVVEGGAEGTAAGREDPA